MYGGTDGALADATLIPSASLKDGEGRWAGHRRRKPMHGYKARVAPDQEAGPIHGVEVTAANIHDAAELGAILPEHPATRMTTAPTRAIGPRVSYIPRVAVHGAHRPVW